MCASTQHWLETETMGVETQGERIKGDCSGTDTSENKLRKTDPQKGLKRNGQTGTEIRRIRRHQIQEKKVFQEGHASHGGKVCQEV